MKKTIDSAVLAQVGKSAEMKENKQSQGELKGFRKTFSIAFEMDEFLKLKSFCDKSGVSINKLIKNLLKEKGII